MAISTTVSDDGTILTIAINGRFDFSSHQDFRGAYENLDAKPSRYVIDMSDTAYLDSSALGMLLLLRDHAGGDNASIEIKNTSTDVKRILTISNFEQLFTID
ncbi:STAS domain-containing protein [Gilvimarinus agarilyticus]|uniref:STAS domain-containing protein n=1 Tax=unclassified Gilvimarinus TaxID=2642066 RepID=UPI001C08D7BF|nr:MULTISPECIES: STAS domain-containing protein [unclassified Gilvimarinus]MBU2887233.1 STAS domain-containing protein [Gilvimarinus agarilyticus]MDO6571892.1 STAS domain-containing protein [Gilvimarinus sp. 2_MG-2023]MDO6745961.1 STAS domain-containing protein [Gilvimarinus sp. 1_MG-2023]